METANEAVMRFDAAMAVGRWIASCVEHGHSSPEQAGQILRDERVLADVLRRRHEEAESAGEVPGPHVDAYNLRIMLGALDPEPDGGPVWDALASVRRHYSMARRAQWFQGWVCGYCQMEISSLVLVCTNCGR